MKKKFKIGIALAAALTIALTAFAGNDAMAATGIDTNKKDCSLSFAIGDTDAASFTDITADKIPVSVYRVASVDVSGNYKALVDDKDGSFQTDLNGISSETNTEAWANMSDKANGLISSLTPISNTKIGDDTYGTTISNLETGLYLVVPGKVQTKYYEYTFTPYLVALPFNNYYGTNEKSEYSKGDDTWEYDLTSVLKIQQTPRYGDLDIVKTLTTYNQTVEGANFVYSIKAVDLKGEVVLSDVACIKYDSQSSTNHYLIQHIPAGATVTVTEVYSGASYKQTAGPEEDITIEADKTVNAAFTNDHTGGMNFGTAAINTFTSLEGKYSANINGKTY